VPESLIKQLGVLAHFDWRWRSGIAASASPWLPGTLPLIIEADTTGTGRPLEKHSGRVKILDATSRSGGPSSTVSNGRNR